MSETTVGSIVGFLRLDGDQFHRTIERAIAEVDALKGKNATVKLDVDARGAEQGIERVSRAARSSVSSMDSASAASRRVADATEKVRIAEVRLGEAQERRNAKQSQILSAERALTVARRAEQDAIFGTYSANLRLADSHDDVEQSTKKVDRSAREASRGMGMLGTSIIALGPAIVPLAAGAVGLGAALGGMGVAGIAAIIGIKSEMDRGTTTGLTYRREIDTVKSSMTGLAQVAAGKVLGSFQGAVDDLVSKTPTLTRQVGDLATMTGTAGANMVGGLLSAFISLNPLMRDAGTYVVDLSSRFNSAMQGGGVVAFGDYVRSVFPQVMDDIESVVTAAGHLIAGFAPLGMGTLSLLGTLSDLISAIPVEVLQTIAPLATAVFIGFRTWQGLGGIVTAFGKGLEAVGVSAERAASGMRIMNAATGIIGAALAVLSVVFTANAEAQRQNQQAVDDYADALRRSNGVVDESIRQSTAKKLADDGVLDAARKLGIALPDVTDAALGNAAAQARVNAVLDSQSGKFKIATTGAKSGVQANTELGDAADKVTGAIGRTNGQLDAGIQKNKDIADATKVAKVAVSDQDAALQDLATRYGTTVPVLQAVRDAQKQAADQHAAAKVQMQQENDAAGLLKQSLDALNGKALSAADAQNAFESSLVNMGTHVDKTGKKITFTTSSIGNMSAASVALRGQLNGQVANLQRVVEANGGLTGSTGKAREQMVRMRQQIIDNAVAHGVDRKAVTEYIDKLLKIPAKVPPTKLDTDKAEAERKAKEFVGVINGVPTWRTVTITVDAMWTAAARAAAAIPGGGLASVGLTAASAASRASAAQKNKPAPKKKGHADGGTVEGPGGPRDDMVNVWLSPGEEVIKNGPAQKHRALLKAINAEKFADGGTVGGGPLQRFAAGGSVAPLGQFYSDYISSLGDKVTAAVMAGLRASVTTAQRGVTTATATQRTRAANRNSVLSADRAAIRRAQSDVAHAKSRTARAAANRRLAAAEEKYQKDRRNGDLQALRDNNAVIAAKEKLAKATKAVGDAEARAKKQAESPLAKFQKATSIGVKNAGAFIANLQKLASRGYGALANQLAQMGGEDAEKIAAQAAGASGKTLDGISAQVSTANTQQSKLDHMGTITAILSTVRSKNLSARDMAAATGIDVMEILDSAQLIKDDLSKNRNASKLLADLQKRSSGSLFARGGKLSAFAGGGKLSGPGTGTSDSILGMIRESGRPIALSTNEYVSTAASTSRNEAALEAGNRGARLGVVEDGGQGGPLELGEATLQRLASMLSRMPIQATVSAGTLDKVMGASR